MSVNVRLTASGSSLSDVIKRKLQSKAAILSGTVVQTWRSAVSRSRLAPGAKRRYHHAIQPYSQGIGAYIKDRIALLLESGPISISSVSLGKGANLVPTVREKLSTIVAKALR